MQRKAPRMKWLLKYGRVTYICNWHPDIRSGDRFDVLDRDLEAVIVCARNRLDALVACWGGETD